MADVFARAFGVAMVRTLLVGLICASLLMLLGIIFARTRVGYSKFASQSEVSGLPAGATDIHWYLPGAFRPDQAYDFLTTEDDFNSWAATIVDDRFEGPRRGPMEVQVVDVTTTHSFDFTVIDDAIAYVWQEEDRGIYLVFDRETGRAYYYSHTR